VFAQGLLSDLMTTTGCRQSGAVPYVAGSLKYRADGGPEQVTLMFDSLSKECQTFLGALMALNVALPSYAARPETEDHVFVYLDRRSIACADHPFPSGGPHAGSVKMEPPTLLRRPRVFNPPSMKNVRRVKTEFVMLGLQLSHTGCVSSATTVRSAQPAFDLEAITSMFPAQWTPAKADGQPVNTHVLFAVSFTP